MGQMGGTCSMHWGDENAYILSQNFKERDHLDNLGLMRV